MKLRRLIPRSVMPLFRKELVEMAARRRTYVIRFVYALTLFSIFLIVFHGEVVQRAARAGRTAVIGQGDDLFQMLMIIQYIAVYALLPASMSMSIAQEKERDSLSLLLLTGLRPWEILLEKFVSRLVPVLMFLLLSLPPMALSYALGGVDQNEIFAGACSVFLACLQIGAISLFMSCLCSTTAAAFVGSYLIGLGVYFVPPMMFGVMRGMHLVPRFSDRVAFALVPMFLSDEYKSLPPLRFLWKCLPVGISIVVFLLLARAVLLRMAFRPSRNAMLGFMQRLDRFWLGVNTWAAGGIILIRDRDTLPLDQPVAWREIAKRSLGKVQYLIRVLLIMEGPVLLAGSFLLLESGTRESELLSVMLFILWPIIALIIVTQAANLISSERTRQTLDVLLTTPMESREILFQKMRGLRRSVIVLALPLLTVYLFEAVFENSRSKAEQLITGLLAIVIYLPMLSWFGCWVGLRIRRRGRAIMAAVIGLVVWCLAPVVIAALLDEMSRMSMDDGPLAFLMMFSPATTVVLADVGELGGLWHNSEWAAIFVNFMAYGGLLVLFRGMCVSRIDDYLGRVSATEYHGLYLPPDGDDAPRDDDVIRRLVKGQKA